MKALTDLRAVLGDMTSKDLYAPSIVVQAEEEDVLTPSLCKALDISGHSCAALVVDHMVDDVEGDPPLGFAEILSGCFNVVQEHGPFIIEALVLKAKMEDIVLEDMDKGESLSDIQYEMSQLAPGMPQTERLMRLLAEYESVLTAKGSEQAVHQIQAKDPNGIGFGPWFDVLPMEVDQYRALPQNWSVRDMYVAKKTLPSQLLELLNAAKVAVAKLKLTYDYLTSPDPTSIELPRIIGAANRLTSAMAPYEEN